MPRYFLQQYNNSLKKLNKFMITSNNCMFLSSQFKTAYLQKYRLEIVSGHQVERANSNESERMELKIMRGGRVAQLVIECELCYRFDSHTDQRAAPSATTRMNVR